MTPEELDDIERRARVNGNIRPERALALVVEVRRLRAFTVDDPTSIYHEHERLRQAVRRFLDIPQMKRAVEAGERWSREWVGEPNGLTIYDVLQLNEAFEGDGD